MVTLPEQDEMNEPIGTLCFSLPDNLGEMHVALHGQRLLSAIMEIDQEARAAIKYRELDDECASILQRIRAICGEEIAFFEECL